MKKAFKPFQKHEPQVESYDPNPRNYKKIDPEIASVDDFKKRKYTVDERPDRQIHEQYVKEREQAITSRLEQAVKNKQSIDDIDNFPGLTYRFNPWTGEKEIPGLQDRGTLV